VNTTRRGFFGLVAGAIAATQAQPKAAPGRHGVWTRGRVRAKLWCTLPDGRIRLVRDVYQDNPDALFKEVVVPVRVSKYPTVPTDVYFPIARTAIENRRFAYTETTVEDGELVRHYWMVESVPAQDLNLGTVVTARGTQQHMTVSEIVGQHVTCRWFEGCDLRSGVFDRAELVRAFR